MRRRPILRPSRKAERRDLTLRAVSTIIRLVATPKWRNGRRGGLKNRWGKPRVGSTPTFGTSRHRVATGQRGVAQPGRAQRSGR